MNTQKDRFIQDGFGKILWLDIVNSEHYDGFGNLTDHLQDDEWLRTLLAHYQFTAVSEEPLRRELEPFRTCLRHIAQTLGRNGALAREDIDTLNSYLAEPGIRTLHNSPEQEKYTLTFQPVQPGWRWVLAETVFSLAGMLDPARQKRVKICPNPGCNWVFFDVTKGNSRRWCNDLTCGNRDKVRRFRARQKAPQS
jgi:predicted RNA-binding Zn ribbon-like protein